MSALGVLNVALPVFLVVALGYLFRRKGWITPAGTEALKDLVVNVTLPAVLFGAFWQASYGPANLVCALAMILLCALGLGLGALLKRLIPGADPLLPFLCTGFEAGMLGYSFYILLFGQEAVYHFAMLDVGHTFFVFTLYVGLLNARSGKSPKDTWKAMATSPILIAMLLGVLLGASGLGAAAAGAPLGDVVNGVVDFVSAPTACVILFVTGAQMELSAGALRSAGLNVLLRIAVTAGLCVLGIFGISRFIPMSRELLFAIIVMFSLPAPFILPIYANSPQEQAQASTLLSLNTLFSIAAFVLISLFV